MTTKSKLLPLNQRSSARGIQICKFCGTLNGNRTSNCKNELCILHNIFKTNTKYKNRKNDETIQLLTYNNVRIYSVYEKQTNQRNIVEKNTSYEMKEIVICYANECKIEFNNGICNHIKTVESRTMLAKIIKIDKLKLYNLNLPVNFKDYLWNLYETNKATIPIVQELRLNLFVVVTDRTKDFPAGWVHISMENDNVIKTSLNGEKNLSKKISKKFFCSCKNFHIIFSDDLKSLIKNEICIHAQLLIAALLSSEDNQNEFNIILNTIFKSINEFGEVNQNLLEDLSFGNDLLSTFNGISNLESSLLQLPADIELVDDAELPFDNNCIAGELEDCQIELMDEFQLLTNQLEFDLCNDNDYVVCDDNELFDNSILTLLDDLNEGTATGTEIATDEAITASTTPATTPATATATTAATEISQPIIETSKSNTPPENNENLIMVHPKTSIDPPVLGFDQWLSFVIESINDTIDYNSIESEIELFFHISEDFMSYFQKKFSPCQEKLRTPFETKKFKNGKFKGKILKKWKLTNYNFLKSVLSNSKHSIELQRNFQFNNSRNSYEPRKIYKSTEINDLKNIEPTLYSCCIYLAESKYFQIEWISNVNEKSNFGIIFFKYNLAFKINNKIVRK